jgi:diguanylate cyclase (GGDEF)-like protein
VGRLRAIALGYVGTVTVSGLAVLLALGILSPAWPRLDLVVGLFVAFTVVGELRPLQLSVGQARIDITTSTTFAFALLLTAGPLLAAVTLVVASLFADAIARKVWWKMAFNAGQYAIAIGAAGVVVSRLATHVVPVGLRSPRDLLAVSLAAITFFVINVVVIGVGVALAQRVPLVTTFRDDFAYQAASNLALLALGPVAVVVGDRSALLLPLLLIPLWVAYRNVAASLENEHQALHDQLTGLPNRTLFRRHAAEAIDAGRRHADRAALLLLDLDGFKAVNDTLGHQIGDRMLQELGPRLRSIVREGDLVSRLGGDEFAVWLCDIDGVAAARFVAGEIIRVLREPVNLDGINLEIDASLGVALYPEHGTDVDVLLQRADVAMYAAKALGSGPVTYSTELDHNSPLQLALVGELRHAIDDGQLVVHYQPKVAVATAKAIGMEALVRWDHPIQGRIPPNDFIPIAEQTGLIRDLTAHVLAESLRQCRTWHDLGYKLPVSVNISSRVLHDIDLPRAIERALGEANIPADCLMLEITESMIMTDPERSINALQELRALGVRLSVDDYGTGHASLSYLKRLPVTEMKIDRTFITRMADDPRDIEITTSTVHLAERLGLDVVAEGVETAEVAQLLKDIGCPSAQGYFYSRPLPSDELLTWLRRTQAPTPLTSIAPTIRKHDPRATVAPLRRNAG